MVARKRGEMPLYCKTHKNNSNALIRKNFTAEMPLYAPLAGVHNAPMPPNAPMYAPLCTQMPRARARSRTNTPMRVMPRAMRVTSEAKPRLSLIFLVLIQYI